MSIFLSRRNLLAAALACAATDFVTAQSSDWPARPVRLIVPSAPGMGSDQLARLLAERLAAALKQPVVIDNRPGANGVIATTAVTGAAPDGYTLLYTNASSTVIAEALLPNLPFKTERDLTPVALTATGGVLLVTNPSVPANNLQELVALLKANPDKYSYGSWGVGSNGHLTMEWLKQKTGIRSDHVPYKGVTALITDLVGGSIQIGWVDIVAPLPFIEQGRLRAIAINGDRRSVRLPNLPTMSEQGYDFTALGFQGIFAPAGTPAAIVNRLHDEIERILQVEENRAAIARLNLDAAAVTSIAQFKTLISDNYKVWRDVVVKGSIKVQ